MGLSQLMAAAALLQFALLSAKIFKENSMGSFLEVIGSSNIAKLLDSSDLSVDELCKQAETIVEELKSASATTSQEQQPAADAAKNQALKRGVSLDESEVAFEMKKVGNVEFEQARACLTIDDALVIAQVSALFDVGQFQRDADASTMNLAEVKAVLRSFGKYYSRFQVCVLVTKFFEGRGKYGGGGGDGKKGGPPLVDKASFFRLLASLKTLAPLEDPAKPLLDQKPSRVLDVVCRVAYPCAYLAKVALMFAVLDTYGG